MLTKRPLDYHADELRRVASGRETIAREEARTELERRRDNLRDAVVPAWELEARGGPPRTWSLW